jgi:tetratricopeptide (TPR) repeat protein
MFLAMCLIRTGESEKAKELLDEKVIAFAGADGAYWLGSIYALLGQKEEAMNWLQRAIQVGYGNYPWFQADANLDSLRQEPRFQVMMDELRARWEKLQQEVQ